LFYYKEVCLTIRKRNSSRSQSVGRSHKERD